MQCTQYTRPVAKCQRKIPTLAIRGSDYFSERSPEVGGLGQTPGRTRG